LLDHFIAKTHGVDTCVALADRSVGLDSEMRTLLAVWNRADILPEWYNVKGMVSLAFRALSVETIWQSAHTLKGPKTM
jgi:hypothetical protein